MGLRPLRLAAAALLLLLLAPAAHADLLQLKDGRWVDGVKMRVEADAVVLQYVHGEVRVPLTMVEDYVIAGTPSAVPETEEAKGKRAEGLVPFKGRWVKPEVREKGLKDAQAKRLADIQEARAHSEWRNRYKFETKNFKFESTLPMAISEEYASILETYFELFKKDWGVKVPKEWGKLTVCFYRNRKEFAQVSGGRGGTLAYYKFTHPRELDFFYERGDAQRTRDVLFHEANHYLSDLIDEKTLYPHWIGEAVAEYYAAAEWDPAAKTVKVGRIQEGRLQEIRGEIDGGKRMTLREIVVSEKREYAHYYWSWSLVHFLMSTPAYEKKFRQYFVDLGRSKEVERTPYGDFWMPTGESCLKLFVKRFGGDPAVDAMEKEWYAYIDGFDAKSLRAYEESGMKAFEQGRITFRAPRQLKTAIDMGSRRSQVHILYARCLRWKGKPEDLQAAVDAIDAALKVCDPLEADLWAEKGYLLYLMNRKDEGKKYIELAREMNPEEPYLDIEIFEAFQPEGE